MDTAKNKKRPEWVRCIQHSHAEKQGTSWCGKNVATELCFQNIDHAIYSVQQSERQTPCLECLTVIRGILKL